MGSGRQWWPWLHIDDLVGAVEMILDRDLDGPVNMVSPGFVTQNEFAKAMGRVLRRPAVIPVPAFALKFALRGLAEELLASRKAAPRKLLDSGYEFKFVNLESALRDAVGS
jgi:NAD dependent epimerase/dehydratase family enzyme